MVLADGGPTWAGVAECFVILGFLVIMSRGWPWQRKDD